VSNDSPLEPMERKLGKKFRLLWNPYLSSEMDLMNRITVAMISVKKAWKFSVKSVVSNVLGQIGS